MADWVGVYGDFGNCCWESFVAVFGAPGILCSEKLKSARTFGQWPGFF